MTLRLNVVTAVGLALLLVGCNGATAPEAAPVADCDPDTLQLREPARLTVGIGLEPRPPWTDEAGSGFESRLVDALAAELGFAAADVVRVRVGFEETVAPGPKPFDLAIQRIPVTAAHDEAVDLSAVYYRPAMALLALPDGELAAAPSVAALRAATLGATSGTGERTYLEATVGVVGVEVFADRGATYQALLGGEIDGTVVPLPTALLATREQLPEARLVALLPPDPGAPGHGFAFPEGSALVPCVDQALRGLLEAGTVASLVEEELVGDLVVLDPAG